MYTIDVVFIFQLPHFHALQELRIRRDEARWLDAITNSTPYMCKLIPALWLSKHMHQTEPLELDSRG
jgi:hypothetical protein